MNKYLISIVGPTAIGKTTLSIKLAQHYSTEIISADSRQFYKEMQVGTAAPTPTELAQAKHHFIHHKSIEDQYNVGSFEKDAIKCLDELFKTDDIVIMVGGSGLYVDAVSKGLDDFPKVDPTIRENLNIRLKSHGLLALQQQLKELDIQTYNSIAIENLMLCPTIPIVFTYGIAFKIINQGLIFKIKDQKLQRDIFYK